MKMKHTLIGLVLLLAGLNVLDAQEKIKWYSIEEAIQLVREEPRIMVIDVYTDWCSWCKRMDATTFSDPEVVEIMNENFYPVKLDAEGKEDIVIGERTFKFVQNGGNGYHEVAVIVTRGRLSYPTISYVGTDGQVLQAAPGYRTPEQFKVFLSYYRDGAYKTRSFEEFSASYQAGL